MSLPLILQSKIIQYYYESGDMWPLEMCLVSKHFFKIVKELIGSTITFHFGDILFLNTSEVTDHELKYCDQIPSTSVHLSEDIIIFDSFIKVITKDKLYRSPFFLYSQLGELIISLDSPYADYPYPFEQIIKSVKRLLKSDQWEEWNNILNHQLKQQQHEQIIKVKIINYSFDSSILILLHNKKAARYITDLDLAIDFDSLRYESSYILPPNLKRLSIRSLDNGPENSYDADDFISRLELCKQLEHLSLESKVLEDYSKFWKTFFYYIDKLNLTSLEIISKGYWTKHIVKYLKSHPSLNKFSYVFRNDSPLEKEDSDELVRKQNQIIDYLLSSECHIDNVGITPMNSTNIQQVKRRIRYLTVGMNVEVDHNTIYEDSGYRRIYSNRRFIRTDEQEILAKVQIQQQVKVALEAFTHVDHLVICDTLYSLNESFEKIVKYSNYRETQTYFYARDFSLFVELLKNARKSHGLSIEINLSYEMQQYWIILGIPHSKYFNYIGDENDGDDNEDSENGDDESDFDYSRNEDEDYQIYDDDSGFEDSENEDEENHDVMDEDETNN